MANRLEQSTALGPLIGKLISFAEIAEGTGYYQIGYVISALARKRDNVINMVLCQFFMTIVAFPLLPFILLMYLLYGIGAMCSPLMCTSVMFMHTMTILYLWSRSIGFSSSLLVFPYLWAISIILGKNASLFLYFRAAKVRTYSLLRLGGSLVEPYSLLYLGAALIAFRVRLRVFFYARTKAICIKRCVFAIFALLVKTISLSLVTVKKFISSRKFSKALSAFFIASWKDFLLGYYFCTFYCASAILAVGSQSVFPFFMGMEILCGSRKGLLTCKTLLLRGQIRYSITHGRTSNSVVTAPVVSATRGQTYGQFNLFNYSIKPLRRQVYPQVLQNFYEVIHAHEQ